MGPFIFEIARSEIGYTFQRPAEYAVAVTAAAIKAGYYSPLFIQGDHFQVSAKKFARPGEEVREIKDLIWEAIEAGFYNIDIDTSTLVDLETHGKGTAEDELHPGGRVDDHDPRPGTCRRDNFRGRRDR